ncbi:hypothetical protein BHM03_00028035 [Ensete ventricosum]|nr:hypothetical protein BHM03_00028035 [Ensete ventricosum]
MDVTIGTWLSGSNKMKVAARRCSGRGTFKSGCGSEGSNGGRGEVVVASDGRRQRPWPVRAATVLRLQFFGGGNEGSGHRDRSQRLGGDGRWPTEEEATEGEGSGNVQLLSQERRKGRAAWAGMAGGGGREERNRGGRRRKR